jgi:hypothetical protein
MLRQPGCALTTAMRTVIVTRKIAPEIVPAQAPDPPKIQVPSRTTAAIEPKRYSSPSWQVSAVP